MNPITKRLSLWSKYLAVMDKSGIRPFRYSETVTITNTPLVKLIVVNIIGASQPNNVNQIKTIDALGAERTYKTMSEFEQAFDRSFNHLRKGIEADFERLVLHSDVKIHFDTGIIDKHLELFKHLNTVEVLCPQRVDLKPGATMDIECPFELEIPSDIIGIFFTKKSLRDDKIKLLVPLLHAEFKGRPKLVITNEKDEVLEINKFDSIAQIQFIKSETINFDDTYVSLTHDSNE